MFRTDAIQSNYTHRNRSVSSLRISQSEISLIEIVVSFSAATKPMPPLLSSLFVDTYKNTVANCSRQSSLSFEISKSIHSRKSLVTWQLRSTAKFSTSSAKYIDSSYNVISMPPDQRAETRRREQLDIDARALERNFTRDWKPGDVYAPHDLSGAEARKWRKRQHPTKDAFDALSMNPLDCYKVSFLY